VPRRYTAGTLASVMSGVEIGLLSLRLSVSLSVSLGDFLLAPKCPVAPKVTGEGRNLKTIETKPDF